jgi:Glyoxalase-like domain
MNTRREFLGWMAGAAILPVMKGEQTEVYSTRSEAKAVEVPDVLDHILLGCSDLQRGIAFVEERTGVKAAFGGVHPGRGTQNALLSLGERRYLEIIAPDPRQSGDEHGSRLQKFTEPRLIGWAAHPGNLRELASRLGKAGIVTEGPTPGSRNRPDGRVLHWATLALKDDGDGLLPFFIEWGAESVHPSVDAPKGCALNKFWIESQKAAGLAKQFALIGIDVEVKQDEAARLRVRIAGPRGEMEL